MYSQSLRDRTIMPESCLNSISASGTRESYGSMSAVPVCIFTEEMTMHIRDFITETAPVAGRRRRSRSI